MKSEPASVLTSSVGTSTWFKQRFVCTQIIDISIKKVRLQRTLAYDDQFNLHLFKHCKRGPV